ncbi:DNA methyltransferase [Stenoxybacter acetivorans]|uniref:DNA methyltransferase n=1 Tax=Stenoxybacter acetivorans TaxID=422441 RepID=UPI00056CD8A9|nr:DNA methyltransferase [Stenoxybacter acetivorans]
MIHSPLLSIKEASQWATAYLGKNISTSNISYLIQYGRVKKYSDNGSTQIAQTDLQTYYDQHYNNRESQFKQHLGEDLNWALSFEQYKEAETTKHVHRLHPYKGKFIPQLVEYFLDSHTDHFKQQVYFHKGDIVLDPFSGSGTTMIQANELGIHAVGIDVSAFNALLANGKVAHYDIADIDTELRRITQKLEAFIASTNITAFEQALLNELYQFNLQYFPVPDYKYRIRRKEIAEKSYAAEQEARFLPIYQNLVAQFQIQLRQTTDNGFLDKWYTAHIRQEIELVFAEIQSIRKPSTRNIISLILSRTIRSCRATTHADLATLLEPVTTTYYCKKHGKICKPLFSILKWWNSYRKDSIKRLQQFAHLRTNTSQYCLTGDSRQIDIAAAMQAIQPDFAALLQQQKIQGIFSSPPYVGLIDYHEQHAYAYDLFGFPRRDDLEIGPLFKGQGKEAQASYVTGIAAVLNNCKRFLADDYHVFLVANDKYGLYPSIAEQAGMTIAEQFHRPVLNRTEKDKNAYSETIFYLRER